MTCLDNKWLKITEMLQTFYTDLLDSKAVVKSSQDFFPSRQIYCQILCILSQKVSLDTFKNTKKKKYIFTIIQQRSIKIKRILKTD